MGDKEGSKTPSILNRSIYGMQRPQTKPFRLSSLNQSINLENSIAIEENPNFIVMNTTSKQMVTGSSFLLQDP